MKTRKPPGRIYSDLVMEGMQRPWAHNRWVWGVARFAAAHLCSPAKTWGKRPRVRERTPEKSISSILVAFIILTSLGRPARAASGSTRGCKFGMTLDQFGSDSRSVEVNVSNSHDGVPPADSLCPIGYGGVLFDLKANEGDLRALFLDVSASYGYLTSLDDYGASLVSPGRTSSLGSIALGHDAVGSVGGVFVKNADGAFDVGVALGSGACSSTAKGGRLRRVSLRLVGCGFSLEHVASQRFGVALGCVEGEKRSTTFVSGWSTGVPDGCDPYEVVEASAGARGGAALGLGGPARATRRRRRGRDRFDRSTGTGVKKTGGPFRTPGSAKNATDSAGSNGGARFKDVGEGMIDAPSGADMEGIYSAGSRNSNVVDRTLTIEGCKDVAAVIGEEEDEGQSVYVHIWEQDTLSSSDRFVFPVTGSSSAECHPRVINLALSAWYGGALRAAFFDLKGVGLDFDTLDVDVCVTNPTDGSVSVLSVEIAEDSVSSVDGINSGDSGFDLAVAFGGESAYLEIQLKTCGIIPDSFEGERATVVAVEDGTEHVFSTPSLACTWQGELTPSPAVGGPEKSPAPTGLLTTVSSSLSAFAPDSALAPTASPIFDARTGRLDTTTSPAGSPTPFSTQAPTDASSGMFSPAPTAPPSASSTPVSTSRTSTARGIVQVNNLDSNANEIDIYESCQEGIAQVFGVEADTSVTVGAPGLLVSPDDDDDDDAESPASSMTPTPSPSSSLEARRRQRRRLPSSFIPVVSRRSPEPYGDVSVYDNADANRSRSLDSRRNAAESGGRQVLLSGSAGSDRSPSTPGGVVLDSRETPRRRVVPGVLQSDFVGVNTADDGDGDGEDGSDDAGFDGEGEDDGDLESETITIRVAFEVILPEEPGLSTASSSSWRTPSSRMAAFVESYAEGGARAALADTLGVSSEEISISALEFCTGLGSCDVTTTVTTSQSVADELGTSTPWETFLKYGGLLLLAIVGTCFVSVCFWAICYRILFYGGVVEDSASLKDGDAGPLQVTSVVEEGSQQCANGSEPSNGEKLDLSTSSSRAPTVPTRPEPAEEGGTSGRFPPRDVELGARTLSDSRNISNGKDSDKGLDRTDSWRRSGSVRRSVSLGSAKFRGLGHRRGSSSLRGGSFVGIRGSGSASSSVSASGSGSASASGGSEEGVHWTSSQFVRTHSLDEYQAQNPLRSSDSASVASRQSSSRSNKSNRSNRSATRRFNLITSKSYKDDFALESVGYSGDYEEHEGEFKTTNPMFLGRDSGEQSPEGSPPGGGLSSPSPLNPAAADVSEPREGIAGVEASSSLGGGLSGRSTTHVESPLGMLSERTSSDTTGEDSPGKSDVPGAIARSVSGGIGDGSAELDESVSSRALGARRSRSWSAPAAAGPGGAATSRASEDPDETTGADATAAGSWGPSQLYEELEDVSPSLSPGASSETSSGGKVGKDSNEPGVEDAETDEEKPSAGKKEMEKEEYVLEDDRASDAGVSVALTAATHGGLSFSDAHEKLDDYSDMVEVKPVGTAPRSVAEVESTAGDRSPTRGSVAATTDEGTATESVSPGGITQLGTKDLDENQEGAKEETKRVVLSPPPPERGSWDDVRRTGMEAGEVQIRTTLSGSPTRGRRRGSSVGLSALRNTWKDLIRGRVGSGIRSLREQGARTTASGSASPRGGGRIGGHLSAHARWSPQPSHPVEVEMRSNLPAMDSNSGSSTSTGRIAADVLSRQTTISAESDLTISDVFTQGALSPAGLAAAAAASSPDLFRSTSGSTGGTPAEAAATESRAGSSAAAPAGLSPRPQGIIDVVAQVAAETNMEEEEAREADDVESRLISALSGRLGASATGGESGSYDLKVPHHLWEISIEEEPGRSPSEVGMSRSRPTPPTSYGLSTPSDSDESPPTMRGALLPARLETPQALLSPTTPPSADTLSSTERHPGETNGQTGESDESPGVQSSKRPERLVLSPQNGSTLSPDSDVNRVSPESPADPRQAETPSSTGNDRLDPGYDDQAKEEALSRGGDPLRLLYGSGGGDGDELTPIEGAYPQSRQLQPSSQRAEKYDAGDDDSFASSALSPWIRSRQRGSQGSGTSGAKEQDPADVGTTRRLDAEASAFGDIGASPRTRGSTESISLDSDAGQGSGTPGASSARPASMGGSGAAEARGGLLAARAAGVFRPLGNLDLLQVMGNLSDPETPTEDVARAVSSSGHIVITPAARPSIVSAVRPSSPITIMVPEDPSPLPHVIAPDPVMSQLSPPTPLPSLTAGHSPGVESTREYSESDVESPDTPGDLMGERLIP